MHSLGYYWKPTHFQGIAREPGEQFRLIGPNLSKAFRSYDELSACCVRNGIDAAQA